MVLCHIVEKYLVVISSKAEGVTTANEIRQVSHIGEKERTGRIAQKRVKKNEMY